MKETGSKYSFFDENDTNRLKDIAFRAGPIEYGIGDKGLILTILGNNAITTIYTRDGYKHIPGATTQIHKQVLAAMEIVASATGEEIEYAFVTSNERLKKWALDPEKGAGLFNWDEIEYEGDELIAYKTIEPLPTGSDMGHGVV